MTSVGAGVAAMALGGASAGQALLLAAAAFVVGQVLYVGLLALLAREEARLSVTSTAEQAQHLRAPGSSPANRAS